MRWGIMVLGLLCLMPACDGQTYWAVPTPVSQPTPAPTTITIETSVLPAEVAVLSMQDLGIDANAIVTGVDSGSANVTAASVKVAEGEMRIIPLGDSGADTKFTVNLREPDSGSINLVVTVQSVIRAGISVPYDAPEEESSSASLAEQQPLVVVGIDGARLTGDPLRVSVANAPKLDATFSSAFVIDAAGGKHIVSDNWTFDPSSNSFVLSAQAVEKLVGVLPPGTSTLIVGLRSEDATLAGTYELTLLLGSAKLRGRIVGATGAAIMTLAGRQVGIVGRSIGVRRVATVGSDGTFSVDGLPPDTYEAQLLDLDTPGYVGGFFAIFDDGATVALDVIYAGGGAEMTAAAVVTSKSVQSGERTIGARAQGTDNSPRDRVGPKFSTSTLQATTSGCSTVSNDVTTFTINSATENITQTCDVQYIIPKGSSAVELNVTVTSEEFPVYTQQSSKYDDQWSYTFSGAASLPRRSDSVNRSHRNSGTVTSTICIDATNIARDRDVTIAGALKSVNIGDSVVTTTVTATFTLNKCGLQVTQANMSTMSKGGEITLVGLNGLTTGSPFLSIPQADSFTTYGVPMKVEYAPKEATLTKVEVGVMQEGSVLKWTENVLSQATASKPGIIEYRDFIVPTLPFTSSKPQLSLTIRLTATIDGKTVTSPEGSPNLTVNNSAIFTPLFLANDESDLRARRYGVRDAISDSWATRATIAWLKGNSYRFDDISPPHAARAPNKCRNNSAIGSVLGHCGHSNGQEIDLRYYAPDGVFPLAIGESGGSGLNALIQASQSGGPTSPATARLVQWITLNRAMIEQAAAEPATLKVHFGAAVYLSKALYDGRYPNDAPIVFAMVGMPNQTMSIWSSKPRIATSVNPHDSHWHITRRAN